MSQEPLPPTGEIILYSTEDGRVRIECRFVLEAILAVGYRVRSEEQARKAVMRAKMNTRREDVELSSWHLAPGSST